ncbi:MauE/DoxX family redox-associated membrane protein [Bacillus sp. 'calajunan']|uniref:MauE/DoxX family redox-associated membrane protein n=1 Tax=Bacillus sp. 'calajunan' TaxID=3447457 RepID=UPI003EE25BF2
MENFLIYMFQYLIRVLSIIAAIIYFKSSIGKFKDIYAFKVVLSDYKVFPKFFVPVITIAVPAIEVAVVVGLFLGGSNILPAAIIGTFMQFCFAVLMLLKLNQVQPNGCGCFGLHSAEKITIKHVTRNIGMFIMFLILVLFPNTQLV